MKNFDFLSNINGFSKVYDFCDLAEQFQIVNPRISAQNGRLALESFVKIIYYLQDWQLDADTDLFGMTTDGRFMDFINDDEMMKRIHYIRKVGNDACHDSDNDITRKKSFFLVLNLYYFVGNVMLTWNLIDELPRFDKTLIPGNTQQLSTPLSVTPTTTENIATATTASAQTAVAAIPAAEGKSTIINNKPTEISEAETRKLYIDLLLEEAGWEVVNTDGAIVSGKACTEIEVEGMPNSSGTGYADYVLFGVDGLPLAVIEAKKTSKDEGDGRNQAELYADCLMKKYNCPRPVIYYTNGFKIKIIDGLGYPPRDLMGYHTAKELQLMITQRGRSAITDLTIDDNITDRRYQKRVITSVCKHFNEMQRRALLVMATGTGKTRVSISLVDVMVRNKWVKNVLFLADRTELVKQAKKNFDKLLPSQTCSLLMEKDCDKNARILFSTYQTMINYIDDESKEFSIGRFDLIIIDEAHRSVFGKYGAIFDYFDSLLLGLTATPRDEVDKNTYELFNLSPGNPTDAYDYQEAVDNGFLVPYHAFSIKSDIITNGIIESKLTKDEREEMKRIFEYEKTIKMIEGDYKRDIKPDEIYSYIYNKDTIDKVLNNLMTKGLKVDNGSRIGKTIIFAYNHNHAVLIEERFGDLYPELGPDFCKTIDYRTPYSEATLLDFEDVTKMPQIAISVDMLDTGIDVPEVMNLVFFKPIHSKIKFWQMIGRGTRLCKDLLGPGRDKECFYIFDHWGNFDYFKMNADGEEGASRLSIIGTLFTLRTDLKVALQDAEHQQDEYAKTLHNELKDILCRQVAGLNRSRIDVRKHLAMADTYANIDNWTYLSPIQAQDVKDAIAPLLVDKADDVSALQFDALMLKLQISMIDTTVKAHSCQTNVIGIARKLCEKASIPQVAAKISLLQEIQTDEFWNEKTIERLEFVRKEIRDLVQYLQEGNKSRTFTVNIEDVLTSSDEPVGTTVVKTYRQRVMEYLQQHLQDNSILQKIYHLETLQERDIRELEHIFWQELGSQEEYQQQAINIPFGTNIAAFIRTIIGIDQEEAMKKYRELAHNADLTRMQEEYLRTIIRYVCQNGDIRKEILVNQQPFNSINVAGLFGDKAISLVQYVNQIHQAIAGSDIAPTNQPSTYEIHQPLQDMAADDIQREE
jgi:type I restriction enzyme R subunit